MNYIEKKYIFGANRDNAYHGSLVREAHPNSPFRFVVQPIAGKVTRRSLIIYPEEDRVEFQSGLPEHLIGYAHYRPLIDHTSNGDRSKPAPSGAIGIWEEGLVIKYGYNDDGYEHWLALTSGEIVTLVNPIVWFSRWKVIVGAGADLTELFEFTAG